MKYTKYKLIGGLDQLEIQSVSDDIKKILSTEQETLKEYNTKTQIIYQNQRSLEELIKDLLRRIQECNKELEAKTSRVIELEKDKAERDGKLAVLQQQLADKTADLANVNTELIELKQQLAAKTAEFERHKQDLVTRIAEFEKTKQALEATNQQLNAQIADLTARNQELFTATGELVTIKLELANLKDQVTNLTKEKTKLEQELSEQQRVSKKTIEQLDFNVNERDIKIQELEKALKLLKPVVSESPLIKKQSKIPKSIRTIRTPIIPTTQETPEISVSDSETVKQIVRQLDEIKTRIDTTNGTKKNIVIELRKLMQQIINIIRPNKKIMENNEDVQKSVIGTVADLFIKYFKSIQSDRLSPSYQLDIKPLYDIITKKDLRDQIQKEINNPGKFARGDQGKRNYYYDEAKLSNYPSKRSPSNFFISGGAIRMLNYKNHI